MNIIKIVWFRQDLRTNDNPALLSASEAGTLIGVYLETTEQRKEHYDSQAKRDFITDNVRSLRDSLNQLNIPLIYEEVGTYADASKKIVAIAKQYNADAVYFNNEYPVNEKQRDFDTRSLLEKNAIDAFQFDADLMVPPSQAKTQQGEPFKVFTPYKKAWIKLHRKISLTPAEKPKLQSFDINSFVQGDIPRTQNYRHDIWQAGELAGHDVLNKFIERSQKYSTHRDIPSINGTSTLSPYFMAGVISTRQAAWQLYQNYEGDEEKFYGDTWLSELIWREFYRQIILDKISVSYGKPFKDTSKEPWLESDEAVRRFEAWKKGETGFPIIDAAMKQLNNTGWMHNRLRMNAAMFLNKLCLVDWRWGERYFMETLIDGDFASNNGGWQWCSSTGADGAPYFRIMSPLSQSKRFDPDGAFIKKMLPELSELSKKDIHNPTPEQRKKLGYAEPIIDYPKARREALDLLS